MTGTLRVRDVRVRADRIGWLGERTPQGIVTEPFWAIV